MKLDDAFRVLRRAWFSTQLYSSSHEREWESEEREAIREANNVEMWQLFDAQTEAIIAGVEYQIAPHCWNDLNEKHG